MGKYDEMTDEDFERILEQIVEDEPPLTILTIPGVWELVSEFYNNEVLTIWENEQGAKEGDV